MTARGWGGGGGGVAVRGADVQKETDKGNKTRTTKKVCGHDTSRGGLSYMQCSCVPLMNLSKFMFVEKKTSSIPIFL